MYYLSLNNYELKSNDLKSSKQLNEDKYDALVFHSFDFECTLWRLFQKCVVYTKLDVYLFLQDKFNVPKSKERLSNRYNLDATKQQK